MIDWAYRRYKLFSFLRRRGVRVLSNWYRIMEEPEPEDFSDTWATYVLVKASTFFLILLATAILGVACGYVAALSI